MRPDVVGGRVRELREAKGWSQKRLAAVARVHRNTVVNVEAGSASTTTTLEALAKALGTTAADLFAAERRRKAS